MEFRRVCAIAVVAGLPLCAAAVVNTSVVWQVSLTGGASDAEWSTSVTIPAAPTTVYARTLVSYIGNDGTPTGLASMVFQPTVSNWDPSDVLLPFVSGGPTSAAFPSGIPGGGGNTTTPVGVVTDLSSPTQFGRVSPWGRSALSSTSYLTGFVHTVGSGGAPAGTWLRIAQHQVTSWIGGTGNTTGGSGIPIGQSPQGDTNPSFNSSTTNLVVFRMALVVNGAVSRPDMILDSPADAFGNIQTDTTSPDFGERQVYWYSLADIPPYMRVHGGAVVSTATIHVVPAPWTVGVLALLAVGRRR